MLIRGRVLISLVPSEPRWWAGSQTVIGSDVTLGRYRQVVACIRRSGVSGPARHLFLALCAVGSYKKSIGDHRANVGCVEFNDKAV